MNREQATPETLTNTLQTFHRMFKRSWKRYGATIKEAAPDVAETIKYQLPTFTLHGNLVHFGAFKAHIGFYPTPSGIEKFQKELSVYAGAKGSVQFPLDQPIPFDLISKIVQFRVAENLDRAKAKLKKQA